MRSIRFPAVVALGLLLAFAFTAGARTLTGAKGFKYSYRSPWWRSTIINWDGRDLPSFDCHVEKMKKTAGVDRGSGSFTPLAVCNTVDGASRLRVPPGGRLVLRDPPTGPSPGPPAPYCDCDAHLDPGAQVWTEGPGDPFIEWPMSNISFAGGVVYPDTLVSLPLPQWRYCVDAEEDGSSVVVRNHPGAEAAVFVKPDSDPTAPIPLLPGESLRIWADGTLGPEVPMLVCPLGDVMVAPGQPAELLFEVWNLLPATISYWLSVANEEGWATTLSDDVLTFGPMEMHIVTVTVVVPLEPAVTHDMVLLTVDDSGGPGAAAQVMQSHWGASFVEVDTTATGASSSVASGATLGQCWPNPFNPATTIPFALAVEAHVRLSIYDTRGRLVTTIEDDVLAPGPYEREWNGTDADARRVASGVYFYRLDVAGEGSMVRKMVLLK